MLDFPNQFWYPAKVLSGRESREGWSLSMTAFDDRFQMSVLEMAKTREKPDYAVWEHRLVYLLLLRQTINESDYEKRIVPEVGTETSLDYNRKKDLNMCTRLRLQSTMCLH
jgi:hypothetical protein